MRRSVARFYLAAFALLSGNCLARAASPASTYSGPDVCALEPKAKVSDACASYADLDSLNEQLHPYVRNLASNTDFFSFYRLNLYNKKCPFWSDKNDMCGNRACAVDTLDSEDLIPLIWRADELSKLQGPKASHPGKKQQRERQRPLLGELGDGVGESCVVEYDDECDERDYCVPEDESASAKGDYVSLVDNPERFTGYSGESANHVWEAIYRENCFSRPSSGDRGFSSPGLSSTPWAFSQDQAQAAQEFKQVVKSRDREQAKRLGHAQDAPDFEDECLEKRVFYRVISGMHASISTHLCYDYLNQTTGEWGPNLDCYRERLHYHPERISNLYFNYALVLRAVGKLRDYVQDYTFCTGDAALNRKTKKMITNLADAIPAGPQIFDERVMFQDQTADGIGLKEDFRNRFRNISRVMDCVGCDKCRLWGKVQTNGLGTALKVLFEFGNGNGHGGVREASPPLLRRTELVALINTLDKISSALKALEHFRGMVSASTAAPESPSPDAAGSDGLDELDDFDEHHQAGSGDDDEYQPQSIADAFREEFAVITQAFIFVFRSWVELPSKLSSILFLELARLWDFWLGRPVQPRSWEIRIPTKDEL